MRVVKFDTEKVVCYHDDGQWHTLQPEYYMKHVKNKSWSADKSEDPGTQNVFLTDLLKLLKRANL